MTMRERLLAVIRGRPHDRVPFVQYDGNAAPNEEIWAALGRDRMGILRWSAVHRVEAPSCRFDSVPIEWNGRPGIRTTLHTPAGSLEETRVREPGYGSHAVREHYVKRPEDYAVLAAYLRDLVVLDDTGRFLRDDRDVGDDGLPHVAVDRTPFQQLWIQWVSLEDLCLHLADEPERVEECIGLLGRNLRRIFDIVARAPVPYVVIPDNITAPAIGERFFRRHCVPYYDELAERLSGRDTPVFVHMDGDLGPLHGAIGESGVRGIDSLSPPPDNDTSAGTAARLWPATRLFVNFPSSVHLGSPEAAYDAAARILEEAGHTGRLEIQTSENVPAGAWRRSYPAIARAIDEFGPPDFRS